MGKGLAYSSTEKTLITELVQKHYIVENKKTDSTSIHEKNNAWEKITQEFNSMGNHPIVSTIVYLFQISNKNLYCTIKLLCTMQNVI